MLPPSRIIITTSTTLHQKYCHISLPFALFKTGKALIDRETTSFRLLQDMLTEHCKRAGTEEIYQCMLKVYDTCSDFAATSDVELKQRVGGEEPRLFCSKIKVILMEFQRP